MRVDQEHMAAYNSEIELIFAFNMPNKKAE
jgi:hypothetical protein